MRAVIPPPAPEPRPDPSTLTTVRATSRSSEDWCTILFAKDGNLGRFHVVALEPEGRRRVLTSSPPFRVPAWSRAVALRQLPSFGTPRHAHDTLVKRLEGTGWRRLETQGRWYDTAFVRTRRDA
jgi:hypothetical protein